MSTFAMDCVVLLSAVLLLVPFVIGDRLCDYRNGRG